LSTSAVAQDLTAHEKFDSELDEVVHHPGAGTSTTRRVIIQATPGARNVLRLALVARNWISSTG
jgi:hypothetical protein